MTWKKLKDLTKAPVQSMACDLNITLSSFPEVTIASDMDQDLPTTEVRKQSDKMAVQSTVSVLDITFSSLPDMGETSGMDLDLSVTELFPDNCTPDSCINLQTELNNNQTKCSDNAGSGNSNQNDNASASSNANDVSCDSVTQNYVQITVLEISHILVIRIVMCFLIHHLLIVIRDK